MKNFDEGFEGTFQLIGICDEIKQCEMLVVALMESNLYELNMNVMIRAKMTSLAYFNTNLHSLQLWHKRLVHLNARNVKMLQNLASGMDVQVVQDDEHSFTWEGCIKNKQAKRPMPMDEVIMPQRYWSLCISMYVGR